MGIVAGVCRHLSSPEWLAPFGECPHAVRAEILQLSIAQQQDGSTFVHAAPPQLQQAESEPQAPPESVMDERDRLERAGKTRNSIEDHDAFLDRTETSPQTEDGCLRHLREMDISNTTV